MQKERQNKILVELGGKLKLRKLFGVSYNTVRTALSGQRESLMVYKIRKAALEMGGVEIKNE
jgi:hypothetical protein